MAQNTPRGTPARVLILFALLTGAVVVAAFRDSLTENADRISYPTAVGDFTYHTAGTEPPPIPVEGGVLTLREDVTDRLQRRDDRMWRVPLAVSVPRPVQTTPLAARFRTAKAGNSCGERTRRIWSAEPGTTRASGAPARRRPAMKAW